MKIVAVGSAPSDFEIGCLETLSKYTRSGHAVNLVIAGNTANWKEKKTIAATSLYGKIGTSKVHFTEKFDYSAVTQDNVKTLYSIIKKANPSLVILPFYKTPDKHREVLAHSALLACRGIKNILMYEITKNKNFSPNIFFTFGKESLGKPAMIPSKINSSIKRKSVQKFNSRNIETDKLTEAFESQHLLLLDAPEIV